MNKDLEQEARFQAGHHLLRLVQEHGIDNGLAIMRGHFAAYLRGIAAVSSWEDVFDLIRENTGKPIGKLSRPYLAVSNEVEIHHPRAS